MLNWPAQRDTEPMGGSFRSVPSEHLGVHHVGRLPQFRPMTLFTKAQRQQRPSRHTANMLTLLGEFLLLVNVNFAAIQLPVNRPVDSAVAVAPICCADTATTPSVAPAP